MLCIQCNTQPIHVKKHQLCSACYQKQWRRHKNEEKEMGRLNARFIKKFFTHNDWLFEPIVFRISETKTFIPNFYDAKNNVFIKIIPAPTTHLKEDYRFFEILFPKMKLEIRTADGEIANYDKWKKRKRAKARWFAMIRRCENPKDLNYKYYGGRGISVCERWHNFEKFYKDIGSPPEGMSLDRTNNDGNYEPGNWRWATHKEQAANSRGDWWKTKQN